MTRSIEQRAADTIRALSMDAVQKANSGHPGMPMGMADLAVVLWSKYLTVDPSDPTWRDRDRFVLSNGHGSMLLYALLQASLQAVWLQTPTRVQHGQDCRHAMPHWVLTQYIIILQVQYL